MPTKYPTPPPGWTPAHTEGLKGLGRGLLTDYQNSMQWIGDKVGGNPWFQLATIPFMLGRGKMLRFPTDKLTRTKFLADRAQNLLREKGGWDDPEMAQKIGAQANKSLNTLQRVARDFSGPWRVFDASGNDIGGFESITDATHVAERLGEGVQVLYRPGQVVPFIK